MFREAMKGKEAEEILGQHNGTLGLEILSFVAYINDYYDLSCIVTIQRSNHNRSVYYNLSNLHLVDYFVIMKQSLT